MLIENKGIRKSNFYIPSFVLKEGEIILLYLYNGLHFHDTEMLLKDVPKHIDAIWNGFWNIESAMYSSSPSDHVDIQIYRGEGQYYLEVYSYRKDIIEKAIQLVEHRRKDAHTVEWIHDNMIKIHFADQPITEEEANELYLSINQIVVELGIERFGSNNGLAKVEPSSE